MQLHYIPILEKGHGDIKVWRKLWRHERELLQRTAGKTIVLVKLKEQLSGKRKHPAPKESSELQTKWIKIQGSKSPKPSQSSQSDPLQEDNGGVKKTCWTKLCWTTEQCEWVFKILLQRKIPSRHRIQHWVELDKELSARFGHGRGAGWLKKIAHYTLLFVPVEGC